MKFLDRVDGRIVGVYDLDKDEVIPAGAEAISYEQFYALLNQGEELEGGATAMRQALENFTECASYGEHKLTCFEKAQAARLALEHTAGAALRKELAEVKAERDELYKVRARAILPCEAEGVLAELDRLRREHTVMRNCINCAHDGCYDDDGVNCKLEAQGIKCENLSHWKLRGEEGSR